MDIPIGGLCSRCWIVIEPKLGRPQKYCGDCADEIKCLHWLVTGNEWYHPDRYLLPSFDEIEWIERLIWAGKTV